MKSIDDYKVVLHNSAIVINDYDWGDCPSLENQFSIWDPIRHTKFYIGIHYDLQNRKLYLPRGLDVGYILRKINSNLEGESATSAIVRANDKIDFDKDIRVKYKPRDEVQQEAMEFILNIKRYQYLNGSAQLGLNLTTGKGKTYICSIALAYYKTKAIIITAQSGILDQWVSRITEYTTFSEDDILKIEGSTKINAILNGNSRAGDKLIYLCTHSTLQSYGTSFGWDKVYELFKKLGIGIKIFDEAHQCFENMALIDYATRDTWKTIYVTATPSRSNKVEDRIYHMYMKNVPSLDLFNPEVDAHTNYIAIKYNSYPKPSDISGCKNNVYGLNHMAYIAYLTRNEKFWTMFDYIFSIIYNNGGKALFYIGTNDAILKIRDRILFNYPELRDDIGIYTSISEDKQLAKTKKYILTTTKSAGAGEDIAHLKYSVVLAEPFRSEVLARQTLGRTRDNNTTYIELVDVGFKQILAYYNAKRPIFKKYASKMNIMNIEPAKLLELRENVRLSTKDRFKHPIEFNVTGVQDALKQMDPSSNKMIPAIYFSSGYPNIDKQ